MLEKSDKPTIDEKHTEFLLKGLAVGFLVGGALGYATGGRKALLYGIMAGIAGGLFAGYNHYAYWVENVHDPNAESSTEDQEGPEA